MKETFSSERTPDVPGWKEILAALADAHQESITNRNDGSKIETFKSAWKEAFERAATTDEMGELVHHCPDSEAQKDLKAKWDRLSEEEEGRLAGTHDLRALKHAYDHAPFDELQEAALQKMVNEIVNEKDARRFHNESAPGSVLSLALEKKFPELFRQKKENHSEETEGPENGGIYDIEDEEAEPPKNPDEKENILIRRIRRTLGLK